MAEAVYATLHTNAGPIRLELFPNHAPKTVRSGKPLPFNDTRHLQAHQFLVDEAYLLDAQQYTEWLDTLTEEALSISRAAILLRPGIERHNLRRKVAIMRFIYERIFKAATKRPPLPLYNSVDCK